MVDMENIYLESQEQEKVEVETSKSKYFIVKYVLMGVGLVVLLLASNFLYTFLSSQGKTVNVSTVNPTAKSFKIQKNDSKLPPLGRNSKNKADKSSDNSKNTNKNVEKYFNAKDDLNSGAANNKNINVANSGSIVEEHEDDPEESNNNNNNNNTNISTSTLTADNLNVNQNLLRENGNIWFSHRKSSGHNNEIEIFSYDPKLNVFLKDLKIKIKTQTRKMSAPIISPDGKAILFILNQKIYAKRIDGPDSDANIVYESKIRISDFCFGPTGDEIIFIGLYFSANNYPNDYFRKIYRIEKKKNSTSLNYVNCKEISNFTHNTGTELVKVKLTPDGRYLAFLTESKSKKADARLTLNLIPYLDGDNKKISIPATDDKIIKKIELSPGTWKDFFSIYPSDESNAKIKFLFYESNNLSGGFKRTIIYTIEVDLNDLGSADLSNKLEIHKSKDQIKSPILSPDGKFIIYNSASSVENDLKLKLLNLEENSIEDLNLIDEKNQSFIGNPIFWAQK